MARSSGMIVAAAAAALTSCASPPDPVETSGSAIASARDDDAEARFRAMLLEAYANALPTGFHEVPSAEAACVTRAPAAKVFSWNAPLGQWFAAALRAELKSRGVGPELWVVHIPLASGAYDVVLFGRPLERETCTTSEAPVTLLTCREVSNDEPLPEASCSLGSD